MSDQIEFFKKMFPLVEVRDVEQGQIYWVDQHDETTNSITVFRPENVEFWKKVTQSANDICWVGNVRFARTENL